MKALITGANRGIGLELTKQYKKEGAEVIAVCRKSTPELDALGVQVEAGIDVSSGPNVQELAERLKNQTLDVLIHNAGLLDRNRLEDLDLNLDSIRRQFEVNSLGPLRVTVALLPNLPAGSRIAIITSRMGSLADNTSGSMYGYRMSKAAVNMAGVSLSHDLKARQISVAIIHPGHVRTEMGGPHGQIDAAESGSGIMEIIEQLNLNNSGTFWHVNGEKLPW